MFWIDFWSLIVQTSNVAREEDTFPAAVIVKAHHLCMGCRGVRQPSTELVTSAMLGTLRDDAVTRGEFLRLSGS